MFKFILTIFMIASLSACSLSVEQPPVANQEKDLKDYDFDGVIAARDLCAETPEPAIVDNDGCPDVVPLTKSNDINILFANDSTKVPDIYKNQIEKARDFLAKNPDTSIELHGYASPVGPKAHNEYLAKARAKNVFQGLVNAGIAADRIKTVGFGDSDPIQADTKEETMRLSRRVVANVVSTSAHTIEEWTIFTSRDR